MRFRSLCVIVFSLAACGRDPTGPESLVINVRVRDDAGKNAGRNLVIVEQAGRPAIETRTGDEGTARITLSDAGTYLVTVVPRNQYLGTPGLTRVVTVTPNAAATVEFTVHRVGVSTADETPVVPFGG